MLSLAPNEKFLRFHLQDKHNATPNAKIGKVRQIPLYSCHFFVLESGLFPTGSPVFLFLPPYSAFPFSPFSSIRHPGVGYADTRVSACSAPGCQHLRHPGVVTQKTALLSTGIAKRTYRKQRIHSLCSTKSLQESSVMY